jgi:hypothetical protein
MLTRRSQMRPDLRAALRGDRFEFTRSRVAWTASAAICWSPAACYARQGSVRRRERQPR